MTLRPVPCPHCGAPLPFVHARQAWHVRALVRRALADHLDPDALRPCAPRLAEQVRAG